MMGRRSDHRIWMMSQVAFAERSILLDLGTWQDQRSRAVRLKEPRSSMNECQCAREVLSNKLHHDHNIFLSVECILLFYFVVIGITTLSQYIFIHMTHNILLLRVYVLT